MALFFRVTTWHDEAGNPHQVSFAVLDECWEVLYEATLPAGPFHSIDEQLLELKDGWRRHMRLYGHQEALPIV